MLLFLWAFVVLAAEQSTYFNNNKGSSGGAADGAKCGKLVSNMKVGTPVTRAFYTGICINTSETAAGSFVRLLFFLENPSWQMDGNKRNVSKRNTIIIVN